MAAADGRGAAPAGNGAGAPGRELDRLQRMACAKFHLDPIDAVGFEALRDDGHYLVLANHQSWVDIVVLQTVLNRRIPFLRFFLKSELIWVPFLGLAWWALDFPFMKRYSRRTLARNPELAGKDIEATRRACEKFKGMPVSVMNFVEGTRFTAAKHGRQSPPYRHLLKPKAGGVAFVMDAMGSALHSVVDATIAYPAGIPTMLDLLSGASRRCASTSASARSRRSC
jgi:1-acyl-sn-glycerol-3-phosphate acyltransferase